MYILNICLQIFISVFHHIFQLIFTLYLNTIKFKVNNVCSTADTCSRSIANMKCDLLHMYTAVNIKFKLQYFCYICKTVDT